MGQEFVIIPVIVMRWLVLGVCAWNLTWSYGGMVEMARSNQNIPQTVRAGVFCISAGGLISSIGVLFLNSETVFAVPMLLGLITFAIGQILFAWTVRRWRSNKLHRFDALMERPDLALPLIELARVDEEAAKKLAQDALNLIAGKAR